MYNDKMFNTKTIFNAKYFKVGEAVKIIDHNERKTFDGLVLETDDNILEIVIIEWNNPICGCSKYESITKNIRVKDIQKGKIEIIKYNEGEKNSHETKKRFY